MYNMQPASVPHSCDSRPLQMTSQGLQPHKPHHSSLFSVFHRKKRQNSVPVAPQSTSNLVDEVGRQKPPVPSTTRKKKKEERIKASQSQTLTKAKGKSRKDLLTNKAFSADNINEMDEDVTIQALLAIGDQQPLVARSTPKHAVLRNSERKQEHRQRQHCLFEPQVYEKMLCDSMRVCDLLANHLDECISVVRAKSPVLEKRVMNSPIPGFGTLPSPGSPLPANSGPYPLQVRRNTTKDRLPVR